MGSAFDLYGCHVTKCCISDWLSDHLLEYQLNTKVVVKHILPNMFMHEQVPDLYRLASSVYWTTPMSSSTMGQPLDSKHSWDTSSSQVCWMHHSSVLHCITTF